MLVHNEVFLSPHCIMPARSPFYRSEDTKPLMQGFPSNGTSQCWPRNQASINGNTVLAPFPLTGIGFLPVVVSAFPFGVSETREDHAARDQDGRGGGRSPGVSRGTSGAAGATSIPHSQDTGSLEKRLRGFYSQPWPTLSDKHP